MHHQKNRRLLLQLLKIIAAPEVWPSLINESSSPFYAPDTCRFMRRALSIYTTLSREFPPLFFGALLFARFIEWSDELFRRVAEYILYSGESLREFSRL